MEILRFQAEAEAAANLRHPNIVAVYETGEHDGQHYFSMEYVPGRNLADIGRDRRVPSARAARYAKTIADAIHYAHEQGTLHRDLKPSNVLIDSNDQPRITDFGLAKRLRGDSGVTVTGQLLGSPGFMPPEQMSGDASQLGPACDVYGVGAILYHLLTGQPPFHASTVEEILRQMHEREPISPRLLNGRVPLDLETICLSALRRNRRNDTKRPKNWPKNSLDLNGANRSWQSPSGEGEAGSMVPEKTGGRFAFGCCHGAGRSCGHRRHPHELAHPPRGHSPPPSRLRRRH